MSTGSRMKERRKELGLSAERVASALNVSPATLYRYEKGDIEKVPGSILEPLAQVLMTTPAYLMGWEEQKTPTPEPRSGRTEEFVELFEKLDDGAQGYVISSMKGILSEQD